MRTTLLAVLALALLSGCAGLRLQPEAGGGWSKRQARVCGNPAEPLTVCLLDIDGEVTPGSRQLVLRWEAPGLGREAWPVTLFYAGSREGPWIPFACPQGGGRYVWELPDDLPGDLYVRLEVLGEDGQPRADQTHLPLPIDLKRPITDAVPESPGPCRAPEQSAKLSGEVIELAEVE